MARTFVFRDGARLTPIMLYYINLLDADFYKEFGVHILVSSGIRLRSEQSAIWYARYVTAGNVRGRKVYDTRWWRGQLWYRISSAGTVLPPDSPLANHVIENSGSGAADLRDSGSDAGIMTPGSRRWKWLRQIVNGKPRIEKYKFRTEGDKFKEAWHMKLLVHPDTPVPKPPTPPKPKPQKSQEDDMLFVRSKKTGNWFVIYDTTVTIIPSGKAGSDNHNRALAYSTARGKASVSMDSAAIQTLLADAAARAKQSNTALAAEIAKLIEDEKTA